VVQAPPVLLLFDRPAADVSAAFEHYLQNNGQTFATSSLGLRDNGVKLTFGALSLTAAVVEPCQDLADHQPIFTSFDPKRSQSAIAVDLGAAVSGGNRMPPVAKAFLEAVALLATGLKATAVAFRPARLLCDATYFSEAVQAYANGAAFPALATISFRPTADGRSFITDGLDWFAGQEIEFSGHGLTQPEMMRRLVRIVHDICTNGPILAAQTLPDIEPANMLLLEPVEGGSKLITHIQIGVSSSLA
jgi:hypothetical protein